MHPNERTIRALRTLADRLERSEIPTGIVPSINHALSVFDEGDDADRLLDLLIAAAAGQDIYAR